MEITILSKAAFSQLLTQGYPRSTALIRFENPETTDPAPPPPKGVPCFSISIPDLDLQVLHQYGYRQEDYLAEADALAAFIYRAHDEGLQLICQCDYGQSRSAACAAAILQHFEGRGIDIFADYRYYPNQLVYHKIHDALVRFASETQLLRQSPEYRKHGFRIIPCPVCGGYTLDNHWICPHCGWEYDGIREETLYSPCNRSTIAQFRSTQT